MLRQLVQPYLRPSYALAPRVGASTYLLATGAPRSWAVGEDAAGALLGYRSVVHSSGSSFGGLWPQVQLGNYVYQLALLRSNDTLYLYGGQDGTEQFSGATSIKVTMEGYGSVLVTWGGAFYSGVEVGLEAFLDGRKGANVLTTIAVET